MRTSVMKTSLLPIFLLMLAFFVESCSGTTATSKDAVLSNIYTSVANTLAAASTPVEQAATYIDMSASIPASTEILSSPTVPTSIIYSSSSSSSSNENGCDNSAYMSDVTISDRTELAPGETFTKTWEFKNTGSCAWSDSYSMTIISGNEMGGSGTDIGQTVDVGSNADISVSLTAPDTVGTYTGYWRLANESGSVFGEKVYVQIVVSNDVATITSTPTGTSTTVSSTSTPTSTPTTVVSTSTPTSIPATATPLPTNTAVPTTVPTSTPDVSPTDTPTS
jgi:hypothetical protein